MVFQNLFTLLFPLDFVIALQTHLNGRLKKKKFHDRKRQGVDLNIDGRKCDL